MAISTYSALQSAVGDWLNRQDLAPVVPTFIALAEAEMNRRLKVPQMVARSDATISDQYTALPSDVSTIQSFYLKTQPVTKMVFVPVDEMARLKATQMPLVAQAAQVNDPGQAAVNTYGILIRGRPTHYTIVGQTIEVFPKPIGTYTGELVYFAKVPTLSDTQPSNWLLSQYPDAYLYGALIHSAPYLKDDDRAAVWSSLFEKSIEQINLAGERAEFSGSAMKARVNRSY